MSLQAGHAVRARSLWVSAVLGLLMFAPMTPLSAQDTADDATSTSPDVSTGEDTGEDSGEDSGNGKRRSVIGIVDDVQAKASQRFNGFIEGVDGFFGSGGKDEFENRSWARIRLEANQPGDEDLAFKATVKLRVVLPRSEQRFRLLLSSEDEEEVSSVLSTTPQRSGSTRRTASEDDDVSLALRFIRTTRENSSTNFDLGVRQRDGDIQLFGRINANVKGEMARYWFGKVSNSYYYYSKSGYENKLRFSAQRVLFKRQWLFFRSSTGFDWEKGLKGAFVSQGLGIYAEISERKQLALEALAGYATALNGNASARFGGTELRIRWRHNVWRPWFFYEVWPSVSWPSSNDYERAYGGLVRVEVVIGSVR